jgi:hypothetical protein
VIDRLAPSAAGWVKIINPENSRAKSNLFSLGLLSPAREKRRGARGERGRLYVHCSGAALLAKIYTTPG